MMNATHGNTLQVTEWKDNVIAFIMRILVPQLISSVLLHVSMRETE